MTRRSLWAVALAALAVALTGCGGGGTTGPQPTARAVGTVTSATPEAQGVIVAKYATGKRPVIYARPGAGDHATLSAETPYGSGRALLTTGRTEGKWIEVRRPTFPNGETGWIDSTAVKLVRVLDRVTVDLDARKITITHDGKVTASGKVAVGAKATPTPEGTFFVTDRVKPGPGSAYGAFAAGLSAHSEVKSIRTQFGRDGQVAIHGWSDSSVFGKAVSHGCIRVPKDVLTVVSTLPLGTPVVIR